MAAPISNLVQEWLTGDDHPRPAIRAILEQCHHTLQEVEEITVRQETRVQKETKVWTFREVTGRRWAKILFQDGTILHLTWHRQEQRVMVVSKEDYEAEIVREEGKSDAAN